MKLEVKDVKNGKTGTIDLPTQFTEEVRADLIKRAVLVVQANNRQAYGANPDAGMRHSAELSRRRRKYRGSYGHGISRVPRKIHSRNGTRMQWVGAVSPGTVGGRRAHAPKAEKIWSKKINAKERKKAIRAALAATVAKKIVEKRGHAMPEGYPFALDNSFESIKKTKDVLVALKAVGMSDELEKTAKRNIRAGKGKMRGRKYASPAGSLVVVSKACDITKSAANIPGITIKVVDELSAELLAPGCVPGRLTLFTQAALEKMKESKLYQ
jgi:large subunit ribosomal protein L4e